MLRIIAATIALIAAVSFTAPGFAATGKQATTKGHANIYVYVSGTIVSVDTATNEVVIKEASGTDTKIVVTAKDASTLKAGDKLKAKIKKGNNTAVSLEPFVAP